MRESTESQRECGSEEDEESDAWGGRGQRLEGRVRREPWVTSEEREMAAVRRLARVMPGRQCRVRREMGERVHREPERVGQ